MKPAVAYRAIALAAVLTVLAMAANVLVTILLAAIIAVILSLPLSAAASFAQRHRLPRAVGALAALVLVAGVLTGLGFALLPQFVSQVRQFAASLPSIVHDLGRVLSGFGAGHRQSLSTQLSTTINSYVAHPARLIGPVERAAVDALGVAVVLALIGIGAFLIALNPGPLLDGALRLIPDSHRGQARELCVRVRRAWIGWLTAIAIDMVVLGGLLFLGMELVGLPFALGFAVFSALMTVIPNYGSIISAIPPVLLGLTQSFGEAVLVAIVYVIVNQIEGNLILPLIMAQRVELHPAVVSIGVLVMAALFGLIGVLIAVPLLSLTIIAMQVLWVEPHERAAPMHPSVDSP